MNKARQLFITAICLYFFITGFSKGYTTNIIFGVIMLCWLIVNLLSNKHRIFEIIKNIYGICAGIVFIIYGIAGLRASALFVFFIVVGGIIIFNYFFPLIDSIKNKKIEGCSDNYYKQCPNGHYYQGDHCPYCPSPKSSKKLVYGHNVFTSTLGSDNVPVFHVKVCPEGHGYDSSLRSCPFCGSEVVSSEEDERAGFTLTIINLPFEKDGVPVTYNFAEADGNQMTGDLCMRIEYTGSFKYAYYVAQEGTDGGALLINPESHVRLCGDNFSETMTGRDFYKICDLVFDKHKSMSEYKQCPNGHYYNSEEFDHCPYCAKKVGRSFVDWGPSPTPKSKVCPNHHAYVGGDACPYCGEKEVVGSVDMHTGQGYHIIARSAGQIIKVIVDGKEYSYYDMKIGYWVWNWASRIKSSYLIEAGGETLFINCNTDIQFGNTHLTGKEFIKMCDVIIDNQLAIIGI